MTEFYEALETAEMFTDEEIIALRSYTDDLAMDNTERFGIPELYPMFQQHFLCQGLDKIITGQLNIKSFQKERPKRQPLSAGGPSSIAISAHHETGALRSASASILARGQQMATIW